MPETETSAESLDSGVLQLSQIPEMPETISGFLGRIDACQGSLFPEEAALVGKSVKKRQSEFRAGRNLARMALDQLGFEQQIILQIDRAPVWPETVTGSITHCDTHCAVAVSMKKQCRSVGIDLETIGKVSPDLWDHLFIADEQEYLSKASNSRQQYLATAMFGAKEAFYKLQHPLTGQWVGFEQASVQITGDASFSITCVVPLKDLPHTLHGIIAQPTPGLVLCLLWLPAMPSA